MGLKRWRECPSGEGRNQKERMTWSSLLIKPWASFLSSSYTGVGSNKCLMGLRSQEVAVQQVLSVGGQSHVTQE